MRAIGTIVVAMSLAWACFVINKLHAEAAGERRTTIYPGTCPNGESWYLIESHDDSVVLGCYDPDYDPEGN